jgi:TonB family protein
VSQLEMMMVGGWLSLMVSGAAVVVAAASPAHARQRTVPLEPCDSVLKAARTDSVFVGARAYLLRRDGEPLTSRARTLLVEAILSRFTAPKPLQVPVFAAGPVRTRMLRVERLPGDSIVLREPLLYGVYDFSLLRDGAVSKVTVAVPTLAPEFDARIVAGIAGLTADSTPALVPRALDLDSLALELRITTGPEDTRIRVPPAVVFTAHFPLLRLVDAKLTGTNPPPIYPREERDDGQDGDVMLRVIVDAAGTPRIETLEVLHATSPAFALAAARALARYHFTPAHVGACPVPQVVEIPFWFSLRP